MHGGKPVRQAKKCFPCNRMFRRISSTVMRDEKSSCSCPVAGIRKHVCIGDIIQLTEGLTMVKKGTEKELKELEKKIGKIPKFFKELTEKEPQMYELVMNMEGYIWDDGALTRKTKKLNRHCDCCSPPRPARSSCPDGRSRKSWCHQSGS